MAFLEMTGSLEARIRLRQSPERRTVGGKRGTTRPRPQRGRTKNANKIDLLELYTRARTGDLEATKALAQAATIATVLLGKLEKEQGEVVRSAAREALWWPVMADPNSAWEKEAAARVKSLPLGAGYAKLQATFREARGTEANLPARRWAKAAVRTIEQGRARMICMRSLVEGLGPKGSLAALLLEEGWKPEPLPGWLDGTGKLEPFSRKSLASWKRVIRRMIREDMPEFGQHADWARQRKTAEASGRDTRGEIDSAILDDIVSALKRIAPEPVCRNSDAELQQVK